MTGTHNRRSERLDVEIDVTVVTVLDRFEATIVDLSLHGARVTGISLPPGTRIQIEFENQTIYGQVRWSEIDRIGVAFAVALPDGPLLQRLNMLRYGAAASRVPAQATTTIGQGGFRRVVPGGFGKRVSG